MMHIGRSARRRGGRVGATIVTIVALVVAFGGLAPAPAAPSVTSPTGSARIVPGESIGPAHLGMTASAAAAALGRPVVVGSSRREYPRYGLFLDFDSGVAVRIWTASPKYRTVAGAGVGSAAGDTARLIGDINTVTTTSGADTTVLYEFQGVGFVFRAGRAVQSFVTAALPFGPPKKSTIVPVSPAGAPIFVPGGPPLPPAGSGAPAAPAPSGGAAPAGPAPSSGSPRAELRGLAASVLSVGGLTLTGEVVNTGSVPISQAVIDATMTRSSGDQVDEKTTIQGPLAPGASAPFTLHAAMVADIIIRYQVTVIAANGAVLATAPAQAVPSSAYATFAKRQIHLKTDLGAPAQVTGPPQVQVLVSVADTGAIPAQWVQQITAVVPYVSNGVPGSANVQLRPGQTQTVLVPASATIAAPQVTGVILSGQ